MSIEPLLSETGDLPTTCYICMEECSMTSPCECKAVVHQSCLREFNRRGHKSKCTICQRKFNVSVYCQLAMCLYLSIIVILLSMFSYIASGFLGEYIWTAFGICDCIDIRPTFSDTIWTDKFVASATSMTLVFGLCVCFCIHRVLPQRWRTRSI